MRIAYVTPGATSSAFLPVPAVNASVLGYKDAVTGQPGTQGIPADTPGVTAEVNGTRLNSGYSGGTRNMPLVWYPSLWFQRTLDIPGVPVVPVGIFSDNQMPIPAVDPRGTAARLAKPPVFLGQRQVRAKRAFPRFSDWLPTPGFGS